MKYKLLCAVVMLAGLAASLSLEAKHHNHFSFNVGMYPSFPRTHVVERYHQPTYVVEEHYYSPYGETVNIYPEPRPPVREVYVYPARAPIFSGFSLGFGFH